MPFFSDPRNQRALVSFLLILCTIALVVTLKLPGLIIATMLVGAGWFMLCTRPDSAERQALRSSISLSADDIQDVITEFEEFETSTEAEPLADRTLYRPALLDLDCSHPAIDAFHYELAGARRFLRRLNLRIHAHGMRTQDLETLLRVTDERACELRESWLAARRAAFRLGPDYRSKHIDDEN
ncbi:hypothetical protein [Corynebacterium macginleyi]|uniref:hypothetical protein n=1 Tax=Corynebacterium macginleyi TaxID=38290 RepID=UPI0019096A65|nr:hypothetical protein [Corynebacterium macginleyi]MBK4138150.1 hypothetical protein [Corynebacterium macginleyi]MBK4141847.1 hypothetical protein [Corynebacterium macginleyi]MBK4145872.1 hypothetical protein [Corynebacterium macginleyi]MBK4148373.1 hypothetical protein [Corynebacterium macginleyi]MBK4158322.1 hypothetical protein [Corynebacterium macginleyi]